MARKSEEAKRKNNEYTKQWKKNNPEKIKIHKRTLYDKKRKFAEKLKSKPCLDCKGIFPACVMDFHHRNPQDKNGRNYGINWGWSFKRIQEEADKCDLLCANCHRIRTWLIPLE